MSPLVKTASKNDQLRRALFVMLVCVLSMPWLLPCTFGLGTAIINRAAKPLVAQPLDYLPHPDLKQWAACPGPMLEIHSGKVISRNLMIREEELAHGAHKAPRPGTNIRGKAADFAGVVSTLLAITDGPFVVGNGSDAQLIDQMPGSVEDKRRQLALCEFPFVLLQGQDLSCLPQDKCPWPRIALATYRSKVTVITPDGTFIGIAQRIHFRSNSSEVILEGNPTVQSGQQHIKAEKPGALMKLNFATRTVTVEGKALETRF